MFRLNQILETLKISVSKRKDVTEHLENETKDHSENETKTDTEKKRRKAMGGPSSGLIFHIRKHGRGEKTIGTFLSKRQQKTFS